VFAFSNKIEHIPAEVAVGPGQQIHERRHGREVGEVRPARAGLDMLQDQRREDEIEPLLPECGLSAPRRLDCLPINSNVRT
jgi:hypothetical protein